MTCAVCDSHPEANCEFCPAVTDPHGDYPPRDAVDDVTSTRRAWVVAIAFYFPSKAKADEAIQLARQLGNHFHDDVWEVTL